MAETQLKTHTTLGKGVTDGQLHMAALNRTSLATRSGADRTERRNPDKSAAGDRDGSGVIKSKYFAAPRTGRHRPAPKPQRQRDIRTAMTSAARPRTLTPQSANPSNKQPPLPPLQPSLSTTTTLILTSTLSPFRQRVLLALLQVPRGQHTTYAALSSFLASSPRAVGNAMRNNPFAPAVPCHRVLAANGSVGGFGGEWGPEGRFAGEKVKLLREEGVRFDGGGRVVGGVWGGFV